MKVEPVVQEDQVAETLVMVLPELEEQEILLLQVLRKVLMAEEIVDPVLPHEQLVVGVGQQ
jgi:hypothetical protein